MVKYFKTGKLAQLIVLLLLIWPVASTLAGTVYGNVSLQNRVLSDGVLEVRRPQQPVLDHIQVKSDGTYQIFLPKGLYEVRICINGSYWSSQLIVDRTSSRQDISLSDSEESCQ